MFIETVQLRDWKSYVDETYEFPRPTRNKNVVLIGAQNGYGKTTLLEALMLCLYGREGLSNVPRATIQEGDEQRLDLSYDEFLRRAFHGNALAAGRNSASVSVTLNDQGQRIKITRQWYFAGNGKHRASEEEVRLFVDDEPFRPGRFDDKNEAVRNFIAKAFVPVYLAPFFLFDGEQVQRLANKDMAAQVRIGIEGLLGVGTLRELQSDLRDYANNRKLGTTRNGDDTLVQLQNELSSLQAELTACQKEFAESEPKLKPLRDAKDGKLRLLTSIAQGNSASIKELYEERSRASASRISLNDKLLGFLNTDLALTLAGSGLREQLARRLRAEEKRDAWITGKAQGEQHLSKLESKLFSNVDHPEPPLLVVQLEWLKQRLKTAWESLWYPPPEDCAADSRHNYLSARERQWAMSRIESVNAMVIGDVQVLLEELMEAEQDIGRIESRIRELSPVADQVQQLRQDIEKLTNDEQELIVRIQELRRKNEGLKAQVGNKSADLNRVNEQLGRSQPMLFRSEKADNIACMIDLLIAEMYPLKVQQVAEAMTRIYKSLAHKRFLSKVEITEECEVRLLDRNGNDLRRFDASAGENQIFAVALISAIAEVSGADVPMVVDTPLARLDETHRMNVLNHLASQSGQVILLSATDEVTAEYYEAVRDRVAIGFHLEHEELEQVGVGVTKIQPGYRSKDNGRRAIASSV